MPASDHMTSFRLELGASERTALLRLLERELRETHMEARRTESLEFQEGVHHNEDILRGLIEKLRHS